MTDSSKYRASGLRNLLLLLLLLGLERARGGRGVASSAAVACITRSDGGSTLDSAADLLFPLVVLLVPFRLRPTSECDGTVLETKRRGAGDGSTTAIRAKWEM